MNPVLADARLASRSYSAQKVRFESAVPGIPLAGDLYLPTGGKAETAFVIIGPMTYQKEQAPTEYARRLAAAGHVAFAFDTRYRGESGGEPRAYENPFHKVEDIQSAVAFAKGLDEVGLRRIVGLGICQGSSEMIRAVAEDNRIAAGVTLAGHYRDREGDIAWLTEDGYAARKAAGEAAKKKYLDTGEVDYVAAVDEADMNVGMPGKFVWDWYHHWSDRGVWENRYAVMSDADLLAYESISSAREQRKPYLMIHSDQSFLPDAARRHFEAMPAVDKTLLWEGDTPHLAYYDQPEVLDRTVRSILDFTARLA